MKTYSWVYWVWGLGLGLAFWTVVDWLTAALIGVWFVVGARGCSRLKNTTLGLLGVVVGGISCAVASQCMMGEHFGVGVIVLGFGGLSCGLSGLQLWRTK